MTVPRTSATRRRSISPIEASEDTTKSKIVIPDGTKATIREQIGGKDVVYEAEIKEDDTQDTTEDIVSEDFLEFDEMPNTPQIPKGSLDLMFDDISFAIEMDNHYDMFFAKLLRQPDTFTDKFNVPCRDIIEIGVIQFSTQDRFNFIPAIQEANSNSGGRFAVSIFDSNYKPLQVAKGRALQPIYRDIGLASLIVPNPKLKPVIDNNGNTSNNDSHIANALIEIAKINQANHQQILQALNARPEKSTLEQAIEQKVLNDILNPPQQNNNGNDSSNIIANVMGNIAVVQAIGDGLARSLNREPPPPPEKTWVDNFREVADLPITQKLIERVGDIGEAVAVAKLNLAAGNQEIQNPHSETVDMANDNQQLITDILTELESDSVLNAENQTIQELASEFPTQFEELVITCKTAPFDVVFNILLNRTSKMQPSPFIPYLNLDETRTQNKYVYNELGEKVVKRLQELHTYLQTVNT